MSNSVQPHRWQPTRLLHPWDSPGKNTGVGCHFLLQCMIVKSESEVTQLCPTLRDPMDCSPPGSSVHGISQARVLEWGAIAFSEVFTIHYLKKERTTDFRLLNITFQKKPQTKTKPYPCLHFGTPKLSHWFILKHLIKSLLYRILWSKMVNESKLPHPI